MKYELQYAQLRAASCDPKVAIGERKTKIIEAESDDAASQAADLFLAGRTMISFQSLHLPTAVLQPKPEFIPMYEAN